MHVLMQRRRGHPRERLVPVVVAAVLVALAAYPPHDPVRVTAAVVAAGLAVSALRAADARARLAGQVAPLCIGILLLGASSAGVAAGSAARVGQQVLAVAAYPFLGRVLVVLVRRHRPLRETDVTVEASLVATAVGIVLHVATAEWRTGIPTDTWTDAGRLLTTMLVGLDVALLVVGFRGLRSPEARRGPVGWFHVASVSLLAAHLLRQLDALDGSGHPLALWVGAGAVGLFGVVALHPAADRPPTEPLADLPAFSRAHAAVVVVALLAAPGALATQAVRGVTPSATVATGSVLSGVILAAYLVQLLWDRATVEHHATHDALTGLPNRTLLVDRLGRAIAHARRNDRAVGLLFVDLDRFKEVNDGFGHAAGDSLLVTVGERLARAVRDEDTVARLSGDEFVVLLPHLTDERDVVPVADRVLAALGEPVVVGAEQVLVAASVGVALYPADGDTATDLLARADDAMYRAKETPGTAVQVYNASLASETASRLQTETELLAGIEAGELVLHYQPIVDSVTGLTCGVEALVRWQHPERGLLPPAEFIPVAERSDLVVRLGEHIVREACAQLAAWDAAGLWGVGVSVNIGARHFSRDLVATVTTALRESGADPRRLTVELTESAAVDNVARVAATLEELRALGVRAAIDDFGTGYCGLQYLSRLPVTDLKIDRSFIQGMTSSDAAIVAATIAMGHSLGLRITAEGVETGDQRRFLIGQGCDQLQGYLLGHPVPLEDIEARLRAERDAVPAPTTIVLDTGAPYRGGDDDPDVSSSAASVVD